MSFLVVRTDVRPIGPDEIAAIIADGGRVRDEPVRPEVRQQSLIAHDRPTALRLARVLVLTGPVRGGNQRIKVIPDGLTEASPSDDSVPAGGPAGDQEMGDR
jgi:hypothetical protein